MAPNDIHYTHINTYLYLLKKLEKLKLLSNVPL